MLNTNNTRLPPRYSSRRSLFKMLALLVISGLTAATTHAVNNTYSVRMTGATGNELAELRIGSTTVAQWEVTPTASDYTATSDAIGELRVVFINDSGSRDLRVDYLSINDDIREAEDQATNTGAWDDTCGGGSYTEMLHCDGYIAFGDTPTSASFTSSTVTRSSARVSSATSSSGSDCKEQCVWYNDSPRPLCENRGNGWGWENQQSCIGRVTCENQWVGSGVISDCGVDDKALCEHINHANFYSDSLYERGPTPDGVAMGHWSLSFADGRLTISQSDYVMTGSYHCKDGEVRATYEPVTDQPLLFSNDYSKLAFDISGGSSIAYSKVAVTQHEDCSSVRGRSYHVDPAELAAVTLPIGSQFNIAFADQGAEMTLGLETFSDAIFDCDLDKLHVHRAANDAQPVTAQVLDNGDVLLVQINEFTQWRFIENDTQYCPSLYDPVCGVDQTPIACLIAPCPDGVYKTYANSCVAELTNADKYGLQPGECEDKEGQPYNQGQACTLEYAPVCAISTEESPCTLSPCPNQYYQTYGNACAARTDAAQILTDSACDKDLEDTKVVAPWIGSIACPSVFDPVCGKASSGRQCITAPCPTHEYTTYPNSCVANASAADITWQYECGTLEGAFSSGEPPVSLVENLATVNKTVSAKATIENDILSVTLSYSGCDEQHFDLQVETAFFDPITDNGAHVRGANFSFIPMIDDACQAIQVTELHYDLLPLKAHYQQTLDRSSGEIMLPNLAIYRF